jgi:VWFA-related protein
MKMRIALFVAVGVASVLVAAQDRVMPGTPEPKPAAPAKAPGTPAPPKPDTPSDELPTIRTTVQVVLVPTTVTDKQGHTVNGLRPEDFSLYDNDKLQQINRDVAFLPLSIVVCIQRSSNVEGMLPKIQKMGNVMNDLLIGADGEAAIVSFDHRIEVVQDFTNDPTKIDDAVSKLKPGGQNFRLNDAMQQAIRMLRSKKDRRKVILLIAETQDKSSEVRPKEVATELQVFNIEVYTLNINRMAAGFSSKPQAQPSMPMPPGTRPVPAIGPDDPTTQAQVWGAPGYAMNIVPIIEELFTATKAIFVKNPAELYTQFTDGREYAFITQADLEKALAAIGNEIRSQYLLSYTPNNKMEGGFHKIQVIVNRPNLKVRTRPGYWMAAVPN